MLHWYWRWLPNILTLRSPNLLHTAAEAEVKRDGLQERDAERLMSLTEAVD